MRPTGVTLIAVFHFISALFLLGMAMLLFVGGTVLGAMFGGSSFGSATGASLGFMVGALGGILFIGFAVVAVVAGYGTWNLREWGRILSIVLAAISLLFSFPGLLVMGLHLNLFIGTYRLFRIAIAILIIWYLLQPQIRALFQRATPTAPATLP
jgi:hypothetical protein